MDMTKWSYVVSYVVVSTNINISNNITPETAIFPATQDGRIDYSEIAMLRPPTDDYVALRRIGYFLERKTRLQMIEDEFDK